MAPLLFRGMKGVNLSCTSPASTSTCTATDSRRPVACHAGRVLDRKYTLTGESRALISSHLLQKSRPESSSEKEKKPITTTTDLISPADSSRCLLNGDAEDQDYFPDVFPDFDTIPELVPTESARFYSVEGDDDSAVLKPKSFSSARSQGHDDVFFFTASTSSPSKPSTSSTPERFQRIGGDESADLKPPPSARSMLEMAFFRASSSLSTTRFHGMGGDESAVLKPSSSSSSRSRGDQVVVLRVSLHCKGCEGKVRKHISRMEGVTSFSIDFAKKKVTVIGDVTPLGVLSSISKVKSAQFWPSPPRSEQR